MKVRLFKPLNLLLLHSIQEKVYLAIKTEILKLLNLLLLHSIQEKVYLATQKTKTMKVEMWEEVYLEVEMEVEMWKEDYLAIRAEMKIEM